MKVPILFGYQFYNQVEIRETYDLGSTLTKKMWYHFKGSIEAKIRNPATLNLIKLINLQNQKEFENWTIRSIRFGRGC